MQSQRAGGFYHTSGSSREPMKAKTPGLLCGREKMSEFAYTGYQELIAVIDDSDSTVTTDDALVVSPINHLRGELRLPGDKSISHRAAIISSLAEGESVLRNFSSARDCEATIHCLRHLGVSVVREGSTVVVRGAGPAGLQEPKQILNAQNSGTTMRLLAGVLAGQPFATTITGDESLLTRPML